MVLRYLFLHITNLAVVNISYSLILYSPGLMKPQFSLRCYLGLDNGWPPIFNVNNLLPLLKNSFYLHELLQLFRVFNNFREKLEIVYEKVQSVNISLLFTFYFFSFWFLIITKKIFIWTCYVISCWLNLCSFTLKSFFLGRRGL